MKVAALVNYKFKIIILNYLWIQLFIFLFKLHFEVDFEIPLLIYKFIVFCDVLSVFVKQGIFIFL